MVGALPKGQTSGQVSRGWSGRFGPADHTRRLPRLQVAKDLPRFQFGIDLGDQTGVGAADLCRAQRNAEVTRAVHFPCLQKQQVRGNDCIADILQRTSNCPRIRGQHSFRRLSHGGSLSDGRAAGPEVLQRVIQVGREG